MSDDPFLRDHFGRFAPGGPGGPGRPAHRDAYLKAFQAAVSPEQLQALAALMYTDAIAGDKDARTTICRYLLPAPARTDDGDAPGMLTAEGFVLMRSALKAELRAEIKAEMTHPDDWHPRKKLLDE